VSDIGYEFTSTRYNKLTDGDGFKLRDANPYILLFSGTDSIGGNAGKPKPLQVVLENFVPLKGAENHVVRRDRPVVQKYEFDTKDQWKIVKFVSLFPKGSPVERREFKKKIQSIEDCKDFVPLVQSEAKWIELTDGTHFPFWIYNRRENLAFSDPGRICELEVFFFGIEMDPKIDEKLFDPERITHEEWKKDFNADQIEKLAKQERAKLLRK
jgi:hypothetical protein